MIRADDRLTARDRPAAGEMIERVGKAKGIPESPISLCTVAVPGTGHVDSAKSIDDQIHSWWIVREMPLDRQRPHRKENPVVGGASTEAARTNRHR